MKNTSKKFIEKEAEKPLLIFCSDAISVYDKTTFFSHLFHGLRIIHWHESAGDENMLLAGIFDMLFEKVIAKRNEKINLSHRL